jgi:hypothetical protein
MPHFPRRFAVTKWLPIAALTALTLAGCGGGGGGGGGGGSAPGALSATGSGVSNLTANVTGASADTRAVRIYGDQRSGPANAYTSSRRLSLVLYRPVTPGTFLIATTTASGTSAATYAETTQSGGTYKTTGLWTATSGSVTVTAVDNRHVEGTFKLTMRNAANGSVIGFQNGAFNVSYETPPPPTG